MSANVQTATQNKALQGIAGKPVMGILLSLSICHCCNDSLQSVVQALYPMIKDDMTLSFMQIGIITFVYQISASLLQPLVGFYLDKHSNPWFLTLAAFLTFAGLASLAYADTLWWIMLSVVLIGMGSSILHPEASRLTSLASYGKRGLAQSVFQVGGNFGGALGPLLAATIIATYGRHYAALVACLAFIGALFSIPIALWYKKWLSNDIMGRNLLGENNQPETKMVPGDEGNAKIEAAGLMRGKTRRKRIKKGDAGWIPRPLSDRLTYFSIGILLILIFSKYIYMSSISNYYTFYLIEKFGMSVQHSQYALFVFFFATALGTLLGGPIGDKIGRKYVIWVSILGTAPFSLAMPYAGLELTLILSFFVGFILSSAFPAILIYAQELLPNRLGMISGLFFGFSFGVAGVASAFWGGYAETHGIEAVYHLSAYLPLLGLVTCLLPNIERSKKR